MKKSTHIFIDEFGNPSLSIEKEGTSSHFIYTAVVISEINLSNAKLVHKQIVDRYFQGTHLKSSNISNDAKGHNKRKEIIKLLECLDHYIYSIVVDKNSLINTPLEFKKSFYKFFSRIIAIKLKENHDEVHFHIDKFGRKEFQDSMIEYMSQHGIDKNLFENNSYRFEDDISEEPLIQLADFYSGCIGKYYCKSHNSIDANEIHKLIFPILFVDFYPREYASFLGANTFDSDIFNPEIFEIGCNSINEYLERNNTFDIGYEIASCVLSESIQNPLRIISSKEISRKIHKHFLSNNNITTEVSKLRDKGILIISPIGKKGYKIPCNEKEIAEFFDRFTSNIIPMLKRLYLMNKILVIKSDSRINVLNKEPYKILNDLVQTVIK